MSTETYPATTPSIGTQDSPPSSQTLRVLFVTTAARMGGWLVQAFASESTADIVLDEVVGVAGGAARLRRQQFDAIVIAHDDSRLNAFDMVLAAKAAALAGPILVIGSHAQQEMDDASNDAGIDAYLCLSHTTARSFSRTVSQQIERFALRTENQRLNEANCGASESDRHAVRQLLTAQQEMVGLAAADGNRDATPSHQPNSDFPEELLLHYRELVRAYVIMGSGSLTEDIEQLIGAFASAHVSLHDAARLHMEVVGALARDLGNRSARHVVDRAGLLAMEMLIRLGDAYLKKNLDVATPV